MSDIELKGNSLKEQSNNSEQVSSDKPLIKANKSAGKKFIENFVNEDKETIKSHILFDIIIPALKDLIFNAFQSTLDMLLYGNGGGTRSGGIKRNGIRTVNGAGSTNYNAISQQRNRTYGSSSREKYCDQPIFESRAEADAALIELDEEIDQYGCVSAYKYFRIAGYDTDNYALKNWGWYDIHTAKIEIITSGEYKGMFVINMPKMEVIK